MRQRRFHGLKRIRVRQTWNKYNLFNLLRLRTPFHLTRTFFQQKWTAKSLTRGYHGEHIKEHRWERMFSRRLLSAVNMDPAYMARHDGSEQAAGRGSGLKRNPAAPREHTGPRNNANKPDFTPYMHMVYAPMERRLDIAIFRSLFASSARQARQFVLHGAVTVNGRKMKHPSYLLNPGDMFQVDIEKVMLGTGRPKHAAKTQRPPKNAPKQEAAPEEADEAAAEVDAEAATETPAAEATEAVLDPAEAEAAKKQQQATLKELQARAQEALSGQDMRLRAKQKKSLRKIVHEIKDTMSRTNKRGSAAPSTTEVTELEAGLTAMLEDLSLTPGQRQDKAKKTGDAGHAGLSKPQVELLRSVMDRVRENPRDDSKPYLTPWRPREWMAPFAFIPRYLEVNPRICAAVYLRHPVARPGLTEVPTPFSLNVSQLAFNWYLRRR